MGRPLGREVRRLRRSMLVRQRLPRRTHRLNNRLPQKYQLWMPQACDDAARKVAAATDDKPVRSWAKHTKRRTCTSYRLTLSRPKKLGVAPSMQRHSWPHKRGIPTRDQAFVRQRWTQRGLKLPVLSDTFVGVGEETRVRKLGSECTLEPRTEEVESFLLAFGQIGYARP